MPSNVIARTTVQAVAPAKLSDLRVGDEVDIRIENRLDDGSPLPPGMSPPADDHGRAWAVGHPSGPAMLDFFSETRIASGDPNVRIVRGLILRSGSVKFQGTLWNATDDTGVNPINVRAPQVTAEIVELNKIPNGEQTWTGITGLKPKGAILVGVDIGGKPSDVSIRTTYEITGTPVGWANFYSDEEHAKGNSWDWLFVPWGNAQHPQDAYLRCARWLYRWSPVVGETKIKATIIKNGEIFAVAERIITNADFE